jgi:hypothetical protein
MKKFTFFTLLVGFSGMCQAVNESGTGEEIESIEALPGLFTWLLGWWPFW